MVSITIVRSNLVSRQISAMSFAARTIQTQRIMAQIVLRAQK